MLGRSTCVVRETILWSKLSLFDDHTFFIIVIHVGLLEYKYIPSLMVAPTEVTLKQAMRQFYYPIFI